MHIVFNREAIKNKDRTYRMDKKFFNIQTTAKHWLTMITLLLSPILVWGQENGEKTVEELVNHGFENVRWTDTEEERIYTIENNIYKAQGVGIAKAIDIIQANGLPTDKPCKVIVTSKGVPEISLTYKPTAYKETLGSRENWEASYDLGNSWKEVKKEKARNSSYFKVDIVVYPELSYKNLIITQIYQYLFTLNPAVEVSLWQGMKLTGQVIIPVFNDGYGKLMDKVQPGFITKSQSFRLPYNIKGRATVGFFNAQRYGMDLRLFRPFDFDNRFSLEVKAGMTGIGYWDAFHYHYDKDLVSTWSVGANFYWPEYNTQFSLKGEQYFLGERGVKFEMIRHFRYASVGFYAVKGQYAKSNGGFKFQILLPPYKYKRFEGKNKYIPRVTTSGQMGTIYNAGNERVYYRQYRSEASDNIMNNNSFNPYFIKSELSNY